MRQYQQILWDILNSGAEKQPTRQGKLVENSTISIVGAQIRHKMADGFPLLTVRPIPIKSLAIELEGFIKGITDKKWFEERGCKYWSYWGSSLHRPPDMSDQDWHIAQKDVRDLGPLGYSHGWRNFGGPYILIQESEDTSNRPCNTGGIDQLKNIVDTLKTNPYDRRLVCSAWDPATLYLAALPPCHMIWGVSVVKNKLNLWWTQRSCDVILGLPSNIASYALLLKLLAREAQLEEGDLIGWIVDAHIYLNQIEVATRLVERAPKKLPELNLTGGPDIFSWTHKDFTVTNYHPLSSLEMPRITI